MRRSVFVGLAAAAAAAGFGRGKALAQTPTVRIVGAAGESMAQPYYGVQANLFAPAGVNVEYINLANGGQTTAAIVSGAAEVGVTNVGSMSAAHVRGLALYLIAPSTVVRDSDRPTTAIAVLKDSPVQSARDLAGKAVGVSTLRDTQQAATMAWIDKNGGDSKAVNFLEIPIATQVAAMEAKRIDAAVLVEPFLVRGKDTIRVLGGPYGALAPVLMTFGWIANKGWYDANPAVARRLLPAIRASAQWANRNPEATSTMLATLTKLPPEVVRTMGRLGFGETLDPAQIQPTIDAVARYGFLPRAFPATELFAPGL